MEDIEKGVETAELWVERLRIASVEHFSKNHVPQDLMMQKKTARDPCSATPRQPFCYLKT